MIGLGCMRLSTAADRGDERGVAVILAALEAGAELLDTADAYCHNEHDIGHNERLIARALDEWSGDRGRLIVATKGGMRRPNGAWVMDGRAKYLREACDASRRALGVDTIDLYQLHAVDQKTPLETSVRGLAKLQDEGKIRDIGLCNVTVSQIRAAQELVRVTSVQVSLSPLDDENLRNGVAEYCRDNGMRLIAYRPLGGERIKQLGRDAELSRIAAKHAATNAEIVLAWHMSFDGVVAIPGATRVETAASLARAKTIRLDDEDRVALDARFSGRLLRVPRAARRPRDGAGGEVIVVMGLPGAGKSCVARELVAQGYERLNRDTLGGSLTGLAPRLDALLAEGAERVVLDNTYPTRKSRNEVIEAAWAHGVPVRCVWLGTDVPNAQINAIRRMLDVHGSLPTPEEIRQLSTKDTRYLLPDAQFRYERTLERPTVDEGFSSVETREFMRAPDPNEGRALIMDFDDLVTNLPRAIVDRYKSDGWLLFAHAWRPGEPDIAACMASMREVVGADVDVACCPHDAGPPVCWCRKPIPGSVLEFAMRRRVALARSIVIGSSAADKTMAERIGAQFIHSLSP